MIFENRIVNTIWGILFFGTLWVGFGFIIPIALLLTNQLIAIPVSIILMLFSHYVTYLFSTNTAPKENKQ